AHRIRTRVRSSRTVPNVVAGARKPGAPAVDGARGSDLEDHPSMRASQGRRAGEACAELVTAVRRGSLEPGHVAGVRLPVVISIPEPGYENGLRGDPEPPAAHAVEEGDADTQADGRGLRQPSPYHGPRGQPPMDGECRRLPVIVRDRADAGRVRDRAAARAGKDDVEGLVRLERGVAVYEDGDRFRGVARREGERARVRGVVDTSGCGSAARRE